MSDKLIKVITVREVTATKTNQLMNNLSFQDNREIENETEIDREITEIQKHGIMKAITDLGAQVEEGKIRVAMIQIEPKNGLTINTPKETKDMKRQAKEAVIIGEKEIAIITEIIVMVTSIIKVAEMEKIEEGGMTEINHQIILTRNRAPLPTISSHIRKQNRRQGNYKKGNREKFDET